MSSSRLLVKSIRERVPDTALRYAAAFLALAGVTLPAYLLVHFHVHRNLIVGGVQSLAFFVVILGAAWLGYGPGLMVCVLTSFGVMRLIAQPGRSPQNAVAQFAVLTAISLLVSRVADIGRRHEAELRAVAAELEERVRQRTAEAVEAAQAAREQAQLLQLAHDAILALDRNGTIRFWNPGAERMYGWSTQDALGRISHDLLQTAFPEPRQEIEKKLAAVGHWDGELQQTCRDGAVLRVLSRWAVRQDANGQPVGYLEINSDITERRNIEDQLRHAQKLESLGVLAGGVAHDFNNLLTGILGNATLALDGIRPYDPNRALLEEVTRAAERAADLTRQLLAYAGKGRFILRPVNLSDLVREISGLIQASIPKSVQLRMELADGLPAVEADPGQLQQIVMNLVINGAEAIPPEGGTVLVSTAAQQVDHPYIRTLAAGADQLRPGPYVALEVHDTGSGMTAETLGKIFDPFFTTKFTGRGLGLSAVQGIVRTHHGALKVYSTPGQGTTFKVLFPALANAAVEPPPPFAGDLAGHGTILIVDDEEIVRQTAKHTLERYGYRAVAVSDGLQAVDLYRRDPDAIQLLLLDLTMPVIDGEQALRELQMIRASVKVLLTSGYNELEAVQRFAGKGLAGFIQKPYTSMALAEKVKQILAG